MSILSVPVTVPVAGDGPVADISSLTGPKTVLLSGLFRGQYDLLGSQDDVNFVAVASFDASGTGEIKQTVAGSFKSVRLRSSAVALATMSCEVSGVVGTNHFGVVASLPIGVGGATAPVDLYALIPPTGPESNACFICTGGFRGSVVVLGSQDGVEYRPVGSYRVDRLPEGSTEALTFPVLSTEDKIRYVKLQLSGSVTSQLTVTVGGSVPLSNPAAEHPLALVVDGADGTAYQFEGWASAANPVTDDVGNSVDRSSGKDVICVGQRNTVGAQVEASPGTVNPIIVYGTANAVAASSASPGAALGHTVVVGDTCAVAADAFACFVGGWQTQVGARASAAIAIGAFCEPGADTSNTVSVGTFINLQTPTSYSVGVGHFITTNLDPASTCGQLTLVGYGIAFMTSAGGSASNSVGIGVGLTATAGASSLRNVVMIGSGIQVDDGPYGLGGDVTAIAIGRNIVANNSVVIGDNDFSNNIYPHYSVFVGLEQTVGLGGNNITAIGHQSAVRDDCTFVTVVDSSVGASCFDCTAIGHSFVEDDCTGCIAIERGVVKHDSSYSVAIGWQSWVDIGCTACTIVGYQSSTTAVAPIALTSVAIFGDSNWVAGANSSLTLVAGTGNTVTNTTNDTVLGQNNVLNSTGNSGFVVVGNNHNVQVTAPSTVVGQYITLTSGWSVAVGYGFTASASVVVGNAQGGSNFVIPTASVYIGLSLNVGTGGATNVMVGNAVAHGTGATDNAVFGNNVALGNNVRRCTVVGRGASVGTTGAGDYSHHTVVGYGAAVGAGALHCTVIGVNSSVAAGTGTFCTVVDGSAGANASASVSIGGVIAASANHAVCVGSSSAASGAGTGVGANSSAADVAVALGYFAVAAAHTGEVGGVSDPSLDLGVNVFTVRGSQGVSPAITNIITFQATTTPAADEAGLTVTYNSGVAITNKTVKAAVVPPVGSVLLYVDP